MARHHGAWAWPSASGTMAAAIRGHDWASSPLGPVATWPQPLRTAVDLVLAARQPMMLFWGLELYCIYNDVALESVVGPAHPAALGAPGAASWVASWGPLHTDLSGIVFGTTDAWPDHRSHLIGLSRQSGAELWTQSVSPVPDESAPSGVGGVIVLCAENARSLRARQESERRVLDSEARFRGVFNSELMGMTVFDANSGETLAINDCFLRMTGYDRADFEAGRWSRAALMVPKHAAAEANAIAQARERGWWDTYETVLRRQGGDEFSARISSAPLPAQPGRVVIAIQDVTAERAAQAALMASEERLRLGLEAGRMVAWEYDFETKALSLSANSVEIFGHGPRLEDYIARLPEADIAADQTRMQQALADPACTYDSEFRYHHPAGTVLHLHNRGRVTRDAAGQPMRLHGVCVDVTERKQAEAALQLLNETLEQEVEKRTEALMSAEEALQQAQKMEALGQLTGGVAHDFNNLLGAMVGSFELIRSKPDEPERVRLLAEAGLRAAERGAKLTSQLLTFSRGQRIELKPIAIDEVVSGMSELIRRTLGSLITLDVEVACDGAAVLSDATQLELAVLNLAINARDAMPDGGALTIATRLCMIERDTALWPGQYVEIAVRDTGTGMTPEVAARAFDPFYTTKGVGKGTGLGLSQVYGIARQSGGAVRIESAPGAGTAVRVLLPCTDGPVVAAAPDALSASNATALQATVLLVDDDPDLRQVLATSLDDLGYGVLEAEDGAAGLDMLERHRPDLLIADFAMPGMTGAELARAARAMRPDLPIIFASGYADSQAIEAAAGPAMRVLRKPFRLAELQAAIKLALATSS